MKKTCLALLLSMVSFGQTVLPIPSDDQYKLDVSVVSSGETIRFYSMPVRVEIAGFDSRGKPYIVVNGSRKKCSRKQWIKFVESSFLISEDVKDLALAYIGAPRNVQVMGDAR